MPIDHAVIEAHLERILATAEFASSPKMRQLLRYLVEASLKGEADRLKGYSIGVDVFDRPSSFDPATDSIVRVQVGRLRKLLERVYQSGAVEDDIFFHIPKGGYVVEFDRKPASPAPEASVPDDQNRQSDSIPPRNAKSQSDYRFAIDLAEYDLSRIASWALGALAVIAIAATLTVYSPGDRPTQKALNPLSIVVVPLVNLSSDKALDPFAIHITNELTSALTRINPFSVRATSKGPRERQIIDVKSIGRATGARYVIEGSVQRSSRANQISIRLIDAETEAHIWAGQFRTKLDPSTAEEADVSSLIAQEVRLHIYKSARHALSESNLDYANVDELFILMNWSPGTFENHISWDIESISLARKALEKDEYYGPAHSVLSDKLSFLASVDPDWATPENERLASHHATRAQVLSPGDANVFFNVALHHFHAGRLEDSIFAAQRALELDPDHPVAGIFVEALPYSCDAAPQNVIDWLNARDASFSPDNPVRWVTLLWLSRLHLNRGDFQSAVDKGRRAHQVRRIVHTTYVLAAASLQVGDRAKAVELLHRERDTLPNLNPRHYAERTIARRCAGSPRAQYVTSLYRDLAAAFEAAEKNR